VVAWRLSLRRVAASAVFRLPGAGSARIPPVRDIVASGLGEAIPGNPRAEPQPDKFIGRI
jgi:hypothetical protein